MKAICIVIDDISLNAGTERAVCNLANLLESSCKYHAVITSLFSQEDSTVKYSLEKGVEIVHFSLSNSGKAERFRSYSKFVKIMSAKYADTYHAIVGTTHALNSLLPKIRTKSCLIGCEHLNYDSCPWYSKQIRRMMYPKLDGVVLLTNADKKHYVDFIDSKKLFVIPNSVSFTSDVTSTLSSKRIIALGRLEAQKGFDYLVEVADILKNKINDWHIDVFGDGSEREKLEEQSRKLNVQDYITFRGGTNHVTEELLNSSIYVMTSRFEGLPMVLIEAQIVGLPIVSFDCPEGPADIVNNGENGFLVPLGNVEEFAERVIEISQNEGMRLSFGKNATEGSKRFNPNNIYCLWDKLFTLLIEKELS